MKARLYVETTVVSYLTAKPSRDLIIAARQQITRDWWDTRRSEFDVYISQLVIDEASRGDPQAAAQRLGALMGLPLLDLKPETLTLARRLVGAGLVPPRCREDALHIAVAAANAVDYLLTWNCRHLANAELRLPLERVMSADEYMCPTICTPEELMGEHYYGTPGPGI